MSKQSEWAQDAAGQLLEMRDDAAIDTACYQKCGFVLAAAQIAISDPEVAERIGALMEPERRMGIQPFSKRVR